MSAAHVIVAGDPFMICDAQQEKKWVLDQDAKEREGGCPTRRKEQTTFRHRLDRIKRYKLRYNSPPSFPEINRQTGRRAGARQHKKVPSAPLFPYGCYDITVLVAVLRF